MAPLRVGLIGFGFAGRTFHAPLILAEPRFRLTAVVSSRPAEVEAAVGPVTVFPDAAALVGSGGVDLVVIATPNDTHATIATAALAGGCHVVVDKPFALDLAEARGLAVSAKAVGRLLAVFQNRRGDSDYLTIREAIDEGVLGTVVAIESRIDRFRPEVRDRWREGAGPGAGLLLDLGPHLVDQALSLFGPPEMVRASIRRERPGAKADDAFRIVLEYGRLEIVLSASMLVADGTSRFLVHGTAGTLVKSRLDGQEDQLRGGMVPGSPGWGHDDDDAWFSEGAGRTRRVPALPGDQRAFYRDVAAAILDGTPNPVAPAQGCSVMSVLDAARRSEEDGGRRIAVRLDDAERDSWRDGAERLRRHTGAR